MAYATQADVVAAISSAELIQIADHDNDGTADTDVVAAALADAESFANSYLTAFLPLTTVPEALRKCVVMIAVHNMRIAKGQATEDSNKAFDQWLDWLKDLSKGTASLAASDAEEEDDIDPGDPEVVAEERVFTRSTVGRLF